MNRRSFLKALAASIATAAVVSPGDIVEALVEPVIDWHQWNRIEISSGASGVRALVNGERVPFGTKAYQKITSMVAVEGEWVKFSPAGCAQGSGIRTRIAGLDSNEPVVVGFTLKETPPPTEVTYLNKKQVKTYHSSSMTDIYVTDAEFSDLYMGDTNHGRLAGFQLGVIQPIIRA